MEHSPITEKERFELELELLESFANPMYIHYLAQSGLLDDPAFQRYLHYLQYWQRKPYVYYVEFPHALAFLKLLQVESFRQAMKRQEFALMVYQQQGLQWQYYTE
ncbi:Mediator of RNA polymerase II transcription subunit 31 [Galdieria sulphuraria]|uniref:Mediator of RNA polymerase II transcription subunit 31 n=1 Tax=Galdieria sulphuraria TaxID=130081 RepID=M2XJ92_GALSU|nr:SOH1-like protein (ISS) isoform 1 [Galdieria sulphuraria]EME30182.1 SOH1-like protein (ISS) isoform 1 [Galdieria sulphuraria]GJD11646.1 Mediator of RNA polymerase II transcription subunit 31 [Galdieria sulphuraria]|eukprot:XP_005706702.1 SOH1-like protein (ISS) isoform 1 [Galdieria sulphuraria]